VLPAPGDRLPGTFDQDVYVGLLHRWTEAGRPDDGAITFTLHALLRALGRKADGRTYLQLRHALARLERTTLESAAGAYATGAAPPVARFTLLSSVVIERRRAGGRDGAEQLALFPELTSSDPGDARVVLAPPLRANLAAGRVTRLSWACYQRLASPVARRLYRLLTAVDDVDAPARGAAPPDDTQGTWAPTPGGRLWRAPLERWAERLPLTQRYPSHLQRVLTPAHEMLAAAELIRSAAFVQDGRTWWVEYTMAEHDPAGGQGDGADGGGGGGPGA
jgi:plasmid replication initiation protein